jgi:hypothetical protein
MGNIFVLSLFWAHTIIPSFVIDFMMNEQIGQHCKLNDSWYSTENNSLRRVETAFWATTYNTTL